MVYTKTGPFTNNSGPPYLDAAFFGKVEDALTLGSARWAPAPSGSDDTAALNGWLVGLTAGIAFLQPGTYLTTASIAVPAGVRLHGGGAKIRGASGSFDMVTLAAGAAILGAEIDGNSAVRTGGNGVSALNAPGVRVESCYIHDVNGAGVSITGSTMTSWFVQGNRVVRCGGQGIYTAASQGRIIGNHIDTAQHGVQWWGGDSNATSTIGVTHLVIANNTILNVTGGIWGSLGQFITVDGNDIATCGDVGIDFEGCQDCTASGGTVYNAKNACLSTFFYSQRITFTGITCLNDANNAAGGNGAGFKAFSGKTSSDITVTNCEITTVGTAVQTDTNALTGAVFDGNKITSTLTGGSGKAFRILDCAQVDVINNRITCHVSTGISFEGPSDSTIADNRITTDADTTAVGSANGGILLYARSTTYPTQRNRVKNNTVVGFVQGINDSYGTTGNAATVNLIEANIAASINHTAVGTYGGVISNNRKPTDLTASTLTTV